MAVRGEASIVKTRITVRRRFWRRVKVVYGVRDPDKGGLGGSEGVALWTRFGLRIIVSGGEEVTRFATLACTMIVVRQTRESSHVC